MQRRDIRPADARVATPELDGQEDHEEGVGAEVGGVGKVRVEGWRAQAVLQQREPRRLPAHNGDEAVAQRIAPGGQAAGVCSAERAHVSLGPRAGSDEGTHSGHGACCPRPGWRPWARRAARGARSWQRSRGRRGSPGRAGGHVQRSGGDAAAAAAAAR